jgi:hypothetical protein
MLGSVKAVVSPAAILGEFCGVFGNPAFFGIAGKGATAMESNGVPLLVLEEGEWWAFP